MCVDPHDGHRIASFAEVSNLTVQILITIDFVYNNSGCKDPFSLQRFFNIFGTFPSTLENSPKIFEVS